jgi:hypothetical protein
MHESTMAAPLVGPPADRLQQDQETLIGHSRAAVRTAPLTVLTQDFRSSNPGTDGLRIELEREPLAVSLLLRRVGAANSLVLSQLRCGSLPSHCSFPGSCINGWMLDGLGFGVRSRK